MRVIEFVLICLIVFLIVLTICFWKWQRKLSKKRYHGPKYEMVEVSDLDKKYVEYYEPKIVEVISSEEYL